MNLTFLNTVKAWIGASTDNDNVLLSRLIAQGSAYAQNYIQRPDIARTTFTELRNGKNTNTITLRNWPVVGLTSLLVNNVAIPAAPNSISYGWLLAAPDGSPAGKPQQLCITGPGSPVLSPWPAAGGYWGGGFGGSASNWKPFPAGFANITAVYEAGYCVQAEARNIPPTAGPYTLTPLIPYGPWLQNDGVTYANGTALTLVTSGTPSIGQYKVAQDANTGIATYTFAAADQGVAILLNYSYVPFDLENAVIELVGELYRYKDRIGTTSKTLGGQETMAYSTKTMPDHVTSQLNPYKLSFPIG